MTAVPKPLFDRLRKELERHDAKREKVIRLSRDMVKQSKQVIYALHRLDMKSAKKEAKGMTRSFDAMQTLVDKRLYCQGAYKVAVQEYVEALTYLEYVDNDRLLTPASLKVGAEFYLMGLSDLTGELIRYAVNQGSKGDYKAVVKTRDFVSAIYLNLMTFTFYGGELRKKFDAIKWDLKRLDEMVFELRMKGKK